MHAIEEFIREREYITNVSPKTIELYRRCFVWLPCERPNQEQLKNVVIRLRERGLSPAGCNIVVRTCNAYLHWVHNPNGKCGPGCVHPRIPRVMEPKQVMPTLADKEILSLVKFKPRVKRFFERRLHLTVLMLLDTGARIGELLRVHVSEASLDSCTIKLDGKGRRQRVVPFSQEVRREIFRFVRDFKLQPESLLLGTKQGREQQHRNVYRSIIDHCHELRFEPPKRAIHAFRHSFALNYVRRGGSVFHLQRMLGHTTLEMSRRYCNLSIDDLKASHEKWSPINTKTPSP